MRPPLSLLCSGLNKPRDLGCSSHTLPSRPFTISVALLWALSDSFMPSLYCGAQTCTQCSKQGHTSAPESYVCWVLRKLEQMELEVREIPPQSRGMYSSRMRSYKQEMGKLEADFKRSRIAYSDEVRNELLGDDGNSSENQLIKLREERAHLLDNTERLERSSRRLEAGYQIAVETEQIGQEMLENLSHDREKIQRARERLRETDANLGKSSRILTGMLRRIIQNRILIVVLALFIILTTAMAIYFSVKRR
uniref:Vesicle transport through interaction with t-SNAREs 1A n=1 Tax=Anser cygnoides TaxID=8845 RepID=A0A8B9DM29_ANSCY